MSASKIHQEPLEIGVHSVESFVEVDYRGPCAVKYISSKALICAFPSFSEALRAARYATTPDGGYGSVIITECSDEEITHAEFIKWAF